MFTSKKIGFHEANKVFKILVRKRDLYQRNKTRNISRHPYLFLSNIFERNIFSNESCSIDTAFLLGRSSRKLDEALYLSFKPDQKLAFLIGKLCEKKIMTQLDLLRSDDFIFLFKRFLGLLYNFALSLSDTLAILCYCLFEICSPIKSRSRKFLLGKTTMAELYSIYYWRTKRSKSPDHYYPDFHEAKNRIAYIVTFFQYRSIFKGLLDASSEENIFTALDYIDLRSLLASLRSLIHLYWFDLISLSSLSYGRILGNIDSLKIINLRFYSLLTYFICDNMIKITKPNSIYLWSENQTGIKAFSVGLSQRLLLREYSKVDLISYFGYPYNRRHFPHLTPSFFEMEHKVWGDNNFMFVDQAAEKEMHMALSGSGLTVNYLRPRKSLNRYVSKSLDPSLCLEYAEDRRLTFFSDSNLHDLLVMLFRFYSSAEIRQNYDFSRLDNLYFRLHPSLNPLVVNNKIHLMCSRINLQIPEIRFIDNVNETVFLSIHRSTTCVFSNSSIINQALEQRKDVVAVKTSFMYDPPILNPESNTQYLSFI